MATVTQDIYNSAEASASVTFNDANGAIQSVQWTITSGTLVLTIYKSGQHPLVRKVTTSGSLNIPNGYNLTKGPRGDWKWAGDPAFEIQWVRS
jgi:hypothetical protein